MYYLLGRQLTDDSVVLNQTSHFDYSLRFGRRMPPNVPAPFEFEVDTDNSGTFMPSLFINQSLYVKELYQALVAAGVDNLETYPAVITHPQTSQKYENYLAVNIVGLVACADMTASQYRRLARSHVFQRLVIQPEKTGGALMFRLAESPAEVLISDQVISKLPVDRFADVLLTEVPETPSP